MDTWEKLENITIDYSGFHGPVASAMVTDMNDYVGNPFYKELLMIGYSDCESDDHEDGVCDCASEETLKRIFIERMARDGLTIANDYED